MKRILAWLGTALAWGTITLYGALEGWWLPAVAPAGDTGAFLSVAADRIEAGNHGRADLVLLEGNEVFAERAFPADGAVGRDTLFPLASMSKLFTAYGVLELVRSDAIDLDAPVGSRLERWQLPDTEFDSNGVTVRRLLSHTAGLTDGLGFGDYRSDETVPSLEETLAAPRASSGTRTIAVGVEPGSEWAYSGGGYLLLQLLIEETTDTDFAQWMQRSVFDPLGMARTTYAYLGDQTDTSGSFDVEGLPAPVYRYAASAATGLSSTPADLVRFVRALVDPVSANGAALDEAGLRALRDPHGRLMGASIWGLGSMLYAPASGDDHVFGHDGANEPAINSALRINPQNGAAIIVLSTGGRMLASEVAADWTRWQTGRPDFLHVEQAIASAGLPFLAGLSLLALAFAVVRRTRRARAAP